MNQTTNFSSKIFNFYFTIIHQIQTFNKKSSIFTFFSIQKLKFLTKISKIFTKVGFYLLPPSKITPIFQLI